MIINNNMNLRAVAEGITTDCYGDEVDTVTSALVALVRDAERFGCEFTRTIPDCWGSDVEVTAVPCESKHSWVFE